MVSLFNTPFNSTLLIFLGIVYQIVGSVTSYDIRLLLTHKDEGLLQKIKMLPRWIGLLHWIETILFILLLLLNWKFAIVAWLVKWVLQALSILEFMGYIITYPFNTRHQETES